MYFVPPPVRGRAAKRAEGPVRGADDQTRCARAALHLWEEPCLSGSRGSGAIFFSGCPLGCVFCQNYSISHDRIPAKPSRPGSRPRCLAGWKSRGPATSTW